MADFDKLIDQRLFCELTDLSQASLLDACLGRDNYPLLPGRHDKDEISSGNPLTYADALAIFVAGQIERDCHYSFQEGLRLLSYAGGIEAFRDYHATADYRTLDDFWLGKVLVHVDGEPLPSMPSTFADYQVPGHYVGPLHQVMAQINHRISMDEVCKGVAPSSIILVNISTANRRLRRRADALGIDLGQPDLNVQD
jgi:hypothetical protein